MSIVDAVVGVLIGCVAGVLSGMVGVGGGVVMNPAINVLLGADAITSLATPLPVILPSSIVGARTYANAGEISFRAARWAAPAGIATAVAGALLTDVVNTHLLLVITSVLIALTAANVIRGRRPARPWVRGETPGWKYALVGAIAGFISGMLGLGGGVIMVPAFTVGLGMPLRMALGTSLLVIVVLAIPGTIVHAALGHIDWAIFAVLAIGVIPGARIGAGIALGVRERTLRIVVGACLLVIALLYGLDELLQLTRTAG